MSMGNNDIKVGLYARLSAEDGIDGKSVSIENQINLCSEYIENNEFKLIDIYYDDGYSGSNFDRPAFIKMIKDIENKKINCVIVKDLSRLGRNFLKVSYYIEDYFTANNIRFISLSESYDNNKKDSEEMEIALRNFLNSYYVKDCSKKRRLCINNKAKTKTLAIEGCYGYFLKDGILQIDDESAFIVKYIYESFIGGIKVKEIIKWLKENHIKTPSYYKKEKFSEKKHAYSLSKYGPYAWQAHSIYTILRDETYIGNTINFRHHSPRYGIKRIKKEFIQKILNTHEPIVDKNIFYEAQKKLNSHLRVRKITDKERLQKFFYYQDERLFMFQRYKYKGKNSDGKYYLHSDYSINIDAKAIHKMLFKECQTIIKFLDVNVDKFEKIFFKNKNIGIDKNYLLNLKKKLSSLEEKKSLLFEQMLMDEIIEEVYEEKVENIDRKIKSTKSLIKQGETLYLDVKARHTKIKLALDNITNKDYSNDPLSLIRALIHHVNVSKVNDIFKYHIIYKFDFQK